MRYLVLSDIHANLEALETVLAGAPAETYDRVLVLGDLVGYGADPNAVVDRVRALIPLAVIRGNHDKAAVRSRRRQQLQSDRAVRRRRGPATR